MPPARRLGTFLGPQFDSGCDEGCRLRCMSGLGAKRTFDGSKPTFRNCGSDSLRAIALSRRKWLNITLMTSCSRRPWNPSSTVEIQCCREPPAPQCTLGPVATGAKPMPIEPLRSSGTSSGVLTWIHAGSECVTLAKIEAARFRVAWTVYSSASSRSAGVATNCAIVVPSLRETSTSSASSAHSSIM